MGRNPRTLHIGAIPSKGLHCAPVMAVIDFQLVCSACRGRLVGVELNGVCPGCNTAVGDSIYLPAFDADRMTVTTDVSCIECQYNLRTLPVGSACPECGTPVVNSLRADLLRFADPKWLGQVHEGTKLLIVVLIGAPCVFLANSTISFWGRGPGGQAASMVLAFVALFAGLLFLSGSLALASRDSTRHRSSTWADPHSLVALMPFCVLLTPFAWLVSLACKSSGALGVVLATTIWSVLTVGFTVGLVCMPICLRRIANRARRRDLQKLAGLLIWLTIGISLGPAYSILLPIASGSWIGSRGPTSSFVDSLVFVLNGISGVGALLAYLLLLYFLVSLRSILRNIRHSPLTR